MIKVLVEICSAKGFILVILSRPEVIELNRELSLQYTVD